jgi:hypothetical protein
MAPLDSALKTGLDSMLWCYMVAISTCYVIVLTGGAMSAAFVVCFAARQPKKSCGQFLRRDSQFSRFMIERSNSN